MMNANQSNTLVAGDVMACYGIDTVSRIITLGTSSLLAPRGTRLAPSHVAIIAEFDGAPLWCESTTLADRQCILSHRLVRGVQVHHPEDRVRDYTDRGGRVLVFRLSPIDALDDEERDAVTQMIRAFVSVQATYDTIGALISGTRIFKRTRLIPLLSHWLHIDLDALFCSEMIAAILQRAGRMNRDNPTKFSPASLVRTLVNQGTYKITGELTANQKGIIWK
jgi:hypothetical protein